MPRAAVRAGGLADIGWRSQLDWYKGFYLLVVGPHGGVSPSVGFGAASTKDQPLAGTCFALRRQPGLPSVGPAAGPFCWRQGL